MQIEIDGELEKAITGQISLPNIPTLLNTTRKIDQLFHSFKNSFILLYIEKNSGAFAVLR